MRRAKEKDVKVTAEGDRGVHVNVTQHQEQKKDANGGQTTVNDSVPMTSW